MILKYGLNLNTKKKPKKPPAGVPANVFDRLKPDDEPEHTIAAQISTQSERQRQKAELEKLKLLAEDPNVYEFDAVYESMAEKKRGHIAEKHNADAHRKPKYFEMLSKRVEERKVEQGVIYQRNIVKERIAEDKMFSQSDAFITSSYKAQMIKDKAWQTQQDLIDRRSKGPTTAGMAGGFLAHLLSEPGNSARPASEELQSDSHASEQVAELENQSQSKTPIVKTEEVDVEPERADTTLPSVIGLKRERPPETESLGTDTEEPVQEPISTPPDLKAAPPKPSKEELAAAARERYLKRKAERENTSAGP